MSHPRRPSQVQTPVRLFSIPLAFQSLLKWQALEIPGISLQTWTWNPKHPPPRPEIPVPQLEHYQVHQHLHHLLVHKVLGVIHQNMPMVGVEVQAAGRCRSNWPHPSPPSLCHTPVAVTVAWLHGLTCSSIVEEAMPQNQDADGS